MTEILTESFCERCGTRYTFESAAPGQRRFAGLKVLGRGLKQFVLSDDASLDEAIAAARSDAERDATNHQLDAFHKTFSFCMSCRQYTCANCWNGPEARCLSCAPLAITEPEPATDLEVEPARLLRFMGVAEPPDGSPVHLHGHPERNGLPSAEVPIAAEATDAAPTRGGLDRDGGVFEPRDLPESIGVPSEPIAPVAGLGSLAGGQAPGQSLDEAIAAYEATLDSTGAVSGSAEAIGQPVPDVAPEDAGHPDVVRAGPTATGDEPVAPVETVEPTTPTAAPPAAAAHDSIVQPVWPVSPRVPAVPPQWPSGPRWPTGDSTRTAPTSEAAPVDALAALMAHKSTDAMWAASSREILQPAAAAPTVAGIRACSNCGISLSATARFCRRCGTPQG